MSAPVLEITVACRSEVGRRSSNEDKVRVCRAGSRCLAILADGAGGHRGGAEASRRAVDSLESTLHGKAPVFGASSLRQAVLAAHSLVQGAQVDAPGPARMHSTVVVLWLDTTSQTALWSHVGDSRLYRARRGVLDLLTADDSVVQRMVEAGLLSAEQAGTHPQKNQLIAALGIEEDVDPHTLIAPEALHEGDAFLLCSDGWWDGLDERAIVSTLCSSSTADEWLSLMHERIEQRAALRQDNFSAIGVWVGEPAESTWLADIGPPLGA